MPDPSNLPLHTGQRIGNYRVELAATRDATGSVYHAVHQLLPRRAIIKVMDSTGIRPIAIQMLREACILEALQHPGIVRVYESGLLADRRPWFARELVDGPTLAEALATGIDPLTLLRDLAEVLEHTHRRGIIHCGLRPTRVVLGRSRGFSLCIVDWSDARTHDATPTPYVPSVASWHYTAPELACGDAIDDRVDVYALGVMAYQLLTGVLPFVGCVVTNANDEVQHVPTEVHCPESPRELTQLVDQMLSYDQWDRPSMAEVHGELAWLVETMTVPARRTPEVVRIRRPRWTPAMKFADDVAPPLEYLASAADDLEPS